MRLALLTAIVIALGCGARSGLADLELEHDASLAHDTSLAEVAVDASAPPLDVATIDTAAPDACTCKPGLTETSAGSCSAGETRVRMCSATCAWSAWSECRKRGWIAMTAAPDGRYRHDAVWTGREMIVYGGQGKPKTEAIAYEPAKGTWRTLPPSGLPQAPRGLVVWAGDRLFIYSGDAAELDPTTNIWTRLPTSPIGRRTFTRAQYVEATGEVVVWGGGAGDGTPERADGAAYRVATRTWRMLAPAPLTARYNPSVLALGDKLLIYGGANKDFAFLADAAVWDATVNTWKYVPSTSLGARRLAHAVRDGDVVYLFGGITDPGVSKPSGATFDFATLGTKPIPSAVEQLKSEGGNWAASAWAGAGRFWTFGGSLTFDLGSDLGASYEPLTNTWTPMPPGGPSVREHLSAVWTGREAIVWGGCCSDTGPFADGALYRP